MATVPFIGFMVRDTSKRSEELLGDRVRDALYSLQSPFATVCIIFFEIMRVGALYFFLLAGAGCPGRERKRGRERSLWFFLFRR